MKKHPIPHMVDLLFALALLCLFAATALGVTILGANVHQNTMKKLESNTSVRTSLTYVAEKVRQNDRAHSLRLDEVGESDALVLTQTVAGDPYETWIFLSQGQLREVLVPAGTLLKPEDGQPITPLADWQLELTPQGILSLTVTDPQGQQSQLSLSTRCPIAP